MAASTASSTGVAVKQPLQSNKLGLDKDWAEMNIIQTDHSYAKSWNTQSDLSRADNAKYILLPKDSATPSVWHIDKPLPNDDDELDVDTVEETTLNLFDGSKVRTLMTECERLTKLARPHSHMSDEPINRSGWSSLQNKSFNKLYKIVNSARLARLSLAGSPAEPVHRRVYCDKHATRVRHLFSSLTWVLCHLLPRVQPVVTMDMALLSWLHSTCMDRLSSALLSDYLEILQALKHRCPSLIEEMLSASEFTARMNGTCNEALDILLKRPWDPTTALTCKTKLEKLPNDPVILVLPEMFNLGDARSKYSAAAAKTKRFKLWNSQLASLAKLVYVPAPKPESQADKWLCFDEMVTLTRASIIETSQSSPGRPIILVGWNFGGLLASYVSTMEKINAVVSLGYPVLGINGLRGDADDIVMDSDTPTFFIVGEHAENCPITEMESMRERMRAQNSLVVVSGANDNLNVNFKTKKRMGMTQSMVDKILLAEVSTFLSKVLTCAPQPRTTVGVHLSPDLLKRKKFSANVRKLSVKKKGALSSPGKKKVLSDKVIRKQEVPHEGQLADRLEKSGLVGVDPSASCSLSLSSSSQGSLAALHPVSLPVPLNVSPEANKPSADAPSVSYRKDTATSHRPMKLAPIPTVSLADIRTTLTNTQNLATLVHLTSQSGQTYAITAEKAKELLSQGVIKSITSSKGFDTTRNLLSKSSVPGLFSVTPGPIGMSVPATMASVETANSQQIRNLLSADGRQISNIRIRPTSKRPVGSAASPTPGSGSTTTTPCPSPGQSLIKKLKTSPSTSISARPAFPAATNSEHSKTKAISLILGSQKSPPEYSRSDTTAAAAANPVPEAEGGNAVQEIKLTPVSKEDIKLEYEKQEKPNPNPTADVSDVQEDVLV